MSKAAELANLIGNINAGGGGVNKNIVINGSMNVAQRGTSVTGIGATTGYPTCDRWSFGREAGTEQARFTMTQDTASVGIDSLPFQEAGIRTALKMDVTTTESSLAAGEASYIFQRIEGFNCSNYDIKNKPITLSFYAKSDTKTGTMCASLYASSGARHHVKEYSITTDWQRFSLTFPADSGATAIANDNTNELQVNFVLTAGSNLQVTGDQWAGGFDIATSNQINFADSTDNNWYLTGVQLEIGQNETEFEREPFDVTREKCYRYTYKIDGSTQYTAFGVGKLNNTTDANNFITFPKEMRVKPTIIHDDVSKLRCDATTHLRSFSTVNNYLAKHGGNYNITGMSAVSSQEQACILRFETADSHILFDAEL
tara:strand:+ start:2217 stop:3329 length:1113 start_codon:yes stop_codon:yes gene_type:complete